MLRVLEEEMMNAEQLKLLFFFGGVLAGLNLSEIGHPARDFVLFGTLVLLLLAGWMMRDR